MPITAVFFGGPWDGHERVLRSNRFNPDAAPLEVRIAQRVGIFDPTTGKSHDETGRELRDGETRPDDLVYVRAEVIADGVRAYRLRAKRS